LLSAILVVIFVKFTKPSEGVHYSFLDSFQAYLGTEVKIPPGDIKEEEGKILLISLFLISLEG